jgi:hypothetical protein
MKKPERRPWTSDELQGAKGLRAQGFGYAEIDRALNRRPGSTCLKLTCTAPAPAAPSNQHIVGSIRAPDHVLAERDARREAADRRDFTSTFFGDPPPGYSARDRRG